MNELDSTLCRVLILGHHVHSFSKDKSVHAELFLINRLPVNGLNDLANYVSLKTTLPIFVNHTYDCRFTTGYSGALFDKRYHNEELRSEIAKWHEWLDKEATIESKWKPLIVEAWEGFLA
jgi:hypothetical protein